MKNKKTLIIVLVIVAVLIALYVMNQKKQERDRLFNQNKQALEQTTGTGLLGYFSNLFNSNQSDGNDGQMSESEAKAISQKIADYLETGTEGGTMQADTLKKELYANGWQYIGYNSVKPVV